MASGKVYTLNNLNDLLEVGEFDASRIRAAAITMGVAATPSFADNINPLRIKTWFPILSLTIPGTFDLSSIIFPKPLSHLPASLFPFHTEDFPADVLGIPSADLLAACLAIPHENLVGILQPIPGFDLRGIGGGHFPEHLTATLNVTQPVNLGAYIRQGFDSTEDLPANITPKGGFKNFPVYIRSASSAVHDLQGRVVIKRPVDLSAVLHGWVEMDLGASLLTQRVKDLQGVISGLAAATVKNLLANIRITAAGAKDLPVEPMKAKVSTHTSDKTPNLDRVARTFYNNKYAFGSHRAGFFMLTMEPIFGVFPDLHADIFAQQFFRIHLSGYIKPFFPLTNDLLTSATAVTPYININKVDLRLRPLKDLVASLVQKGAFKGLVTIIRPLRHGQTSTAPNAGFVTTATTYKFLLGTSRGLFIPPQVVPEIRISTYKNESLMPDLHATVRGWGVWGLSASISDYPYTIISASATAIAPDRYRDFLALLTPARGVNLSAQIASSGAFLSLLAVLMPAGQAANLTASVQSAINPLAFNVVTVSTKPFKDLSALINYGSIVGCASSSGAFNLPATLRPLVGGTSDTSSNLSATLNVLRMEVTLPSEIIGRKRTRIRILSLNFRANIRDSANIIGIAVPVHPLQEQLQGSIVGMSHEFDLPATLTPSRHIPPTARFTGFETLVNLQNALSVKEVFISFRSQVSSYVYEEIASAVYATDRGTWAIDLRTQAEQESFFDLDPENRSLLLDNVSEYYSVDEAIRAALVILCERRRNDLGASLTAGGGSFDLRSSMQVTSIDRFSSLFGGLVAVINSPDLSATINTGIGSSALLPLRGVLNPSYSSAQGIAGSVTGHIINDLTANISAS